jgi:hypothetical protein
LLAGEFAGGVVSVGVDPGAAPPVWGGAAPPWAVPGFDWVVVGVGVVVVAVVVEVDVLVVVVPFVELTTVGVFVSPGTVSFGVVGSGSLAFWLPPPPQAARKGTRAVSAVASSAARMVTALPLDRGKPAATGRAVRDVLRCELLERTSTQPQVLDRPREVAGARGEREHFPDHLELLTALTIDIDGPRLDLANDLAVAPGAQAI